MLIPRAAFGVAGAVAPEASRYAINGVLVSRDASGCQAVGTDGHVMLAAEWAEVDVSTYPDAAGLDGVRIGGTGPIERIVPVKAWKDVGAKVPVNGRREDLRVGLLEEAGVSRFRMGYVGADLNASIVGVDGIEGTFPKWRECIPKEHPVAEVSFDLFLLKKLVDGMCGMWKGAETATVRLSVFPCGKRGAERPVMLTGVAPGEVSVTGLIVPLARSVKAEPAEDETKPAKAETELESIRRQIAELEAVVAGTKAAE